MLDLPLKSVERQVFLNSKLNVIFSADPLDKRAVNFLDHLLKHVDDRTVTWEHSEDLVPYLAVSIFTGPSGYFSHAVSLDSYDKLSKKQWRELRNRVDQILDDFEFEKFGSRGFLFYPEKQDTEEIDKSSEDIAVKLAAARKLKEKYKVLQSEIKEMLDRGDKPPQIAEHYKLNEQDVKYYLHNAVTGRPTPAELAKTILLNTQEAKDSGLGQKSQLEDEVLNRDLNKVFPKRRRSFSKKRLARRLTDEELKVLADFQSAPERFVAT
jgi:hypothetical protein